MLHSSCKTIQVLWLHKKHTTATRKIKKKQHLNSTLCFCILDSRCKYEQPLFLYLIQSKIMYDLLLPIWATNYTFYPSNNMDFVGLLGVTSILLMISRPWLKYRRGNPRLGELLPSPLRGRDPFRPSPQHRLPGSAEPQPAPARRAF